MTYRRRFPSKRRRAAVVAVFAALVLFMIEPEATRAQDCSELTADGTVREVSFTGGQGRRDLFFFFFFFFFLLLWVCHHVIVECNAACPAMIATIICLSRCSAPLPTRALSRRHFGRRVLADIRPTRPPRRRGLPIDFGAEEL